MTAQEFLARLEKVKPNAKGWMARCPAHDDGTASLSVARGSDGRVLLNCHAGCKAEDVAGALSLKLSDLFVDEPKRSEPDATYDYHDERGRMLFQVVRKPGKKFVQRRPVGTEWEYKLGDTRRVLYRLPQLIASAEDEETVFACEGEKDVATLVRHGLVATCNAGGAGKWRPEYSESLRGRTVVVLPDNDDPGRAHAELVAKSLQGIAASVRVVELPGLPEKGDVTDWFSRGGSTGNLSALVSEQPIWPERKAEPPRGFISSADRADRLLDDVAERAKTSRPFHVSFLDDIAVGLLDTDLVVLGAPTGAGKTTLAAIFAQNAASKDGRVHYFALEAHEGEIEQRMLFRIMSDLAWRGHVADRRTLDAFTYARWCHGRCDVVASRVQAEALTRLKQSTRNLWTFYRSGSFTTEDLVKAIRSVRGESDLIVLDHLHFIDAGDADEIRAMRHTVKAVSDAIQDARTPVIAIAHLRKTDTKSKSIIPHIAEFHGSSDITKVATKVITLAPVRIRDRAVSYVADTFVHASKDRLVGEQNYTAILGFDMRTNGYRRPYELGRTIKGGTDWEAIPLIEIPWWAVNEARHLRAQEQGSQAA